MPNTLIWNYLKTILINVSINGVNSIILKIIV